MEKKDKYNILKELLKTGERDKIILAKKMGYTGATDKRLRDSFNRFLKNNEDLKKLYENKEKTKSTDKAITKEIEKAPNKSARNLPAINNFEDLVKIADQDPIIKILTKEIIKMKKDIYNQNNYTSESSDIFTMDNKYNEMVSDDIIPVSLRITREAKKKLDKFAKDNSSHKKVYIVSQMIEEFIKKYS